jgi:hypothetical protein
MPSPQEGNGSPAQELGIYLRDISETPLLEMDEEHQCGKELRGDIE